MRGGHVGTLPRDVCSPRAAPARSTRAVEADAADLLEPAQALRARGKGRLVTYSPKVFIPLTKLCRDVCHYCTFARRRGAASAPT